MFIQPLKRYLEMGSYKYSRQYSMIVAKHASTRSAIVALKCQNSSEEERGGLSSCSRIKCTKLLRIDKSMRFQKLSWKINGEDRDIKNYFQLENQWWIMNYKTKFSIKEKMSTKFDEVVTICSNLPNPKASQLIQ